MRLNVRGALLTEETSRKLREDIELETKKDWTFEDIQELINEGDYFIRTHDDSIRDFYGNSNYIVHRPYYTLSTKNSWSNEIYDAYNLYSDIDGIVYQIYMKEKSK